MKVSNSFVAALVLVAAGILPHIAGGAMRRIALQAPVTAGNNAIKRDVYAIYSRLISSPDDIYLIDGMTLTESEGFGPPFRARSSGDLLSCVRAPQEDAAGFDEARADFGLRKDMPVVLERQFILNRPYQLLNRDEVMTFLQDALKSTPQVVPPGGIPPNPNPLFPRAKRVFRLSDVYFNKDRTLAFTYISVMTTAADGMGGWKIFKKPRNADWQEVLYGNPAPGTPIWRTCGWGAGR